MEEKQDVYTRLVARNRRDKRIVCVAAISSLSAAGVFAYLWGFYFYITVWSGQTVQTVPLIPILIELALGFIFVVFTGLLYTTMYCLWGSGRVDWLKKWVVPGCCGRVPRRSSL